MQAAKAFGVLARTIRFWFCLAVAVISAATVDPVVEFASNHGVFGPGNFTDHSNLDVLPALLAGAFLAALIVALRVRSALADPASRPPDLLRASSRALRSGLLRLLPMAFCMQIAVLFAMETTEQFAVAGHGLGGTIWLGGPVCLSLAAHAFACVVMAYALAKAIHACASATLRIIRFVHALVTLPTRTDPAVVTRRHDPLVRSLAHRSVRNIGERAPPLATA
jgi:hypothetical protein